jgi:hypothetical protein
MTTALEGGDGSASRPGRSLHPGNTRYPLYRRLGGPQGWSGKVRKISPPPGFDARTVHPVASRHTDYVTRPTNFIIYLHAIRTTIFNYLYIILTSVFNSTTARTTMTYFANVAFFLFEYLPEDGRKRPKHVGGLLRDFIHMHLTTVQVLE